MSVVCTLLRIGKMFYIFTFYTLEKQKQALNKFLSVCLSVDNALRRVFVRASDFVISSQKEPTGSCLSGAPWSGKGTGSRGFQDNWWFQHLNTGSVSRRTLLLQVLASSDNIGVRLRAYSRSCTDTATRIFKRDMV